MLNDKEFGNCSCLSLDEPTDRIGGYVDDFSFSGPFLTEPLDSQTISPMYDKVRAGPCINNCSRPYLLFMVLTCIIQTLGCSGRIGNVLVNYRSVEKKDKSFAQGISLMIISLLALIPGPIIYGAIIDSTCLIWDETCGTRGNCWFHHRDNFRYFVNVSSAGAC